MFSRIYCAKALRWILQSSCFSLFLLISYRLEASLIGHMLVQLPLLVVVGVYGGFQLPHHWRSVFMKSIGVAGLVLATFVSAFWMIPRSLDAALTRPMIEVAKYLSLPLLVGVPLNLSWSSLGFVGKGFFVLNSAAMLGAIGYLYLIAPVRLCNAYLSDQQAPAGEILIFFSAALVIAWFALSSRLPAHTHREWKNTDSR